MEGKDYEKKYLKYKTKYLELKIGGGKLLTFKQIKNEFDKLKSKNNILYYKRYINAIENEKLEITSISEEKDKKNNKYLLIKYKDVGVQSVNKDKEGSDNVNNANTFQFTEATYYLNIIKDNEGNYVLQSCNDCKGIGYV